MLENVQLDIYSDLICPWCYIGKRRLEQALKQLQSDLKVNVAWHPFELNPQMKPEGMDRKEYRSAKFGSWSYSQQLDAQVSDAGREVGLAFNFDSIQRTPNTLDSHRLVWLAHQYNLQDALVEHLFAAYFIAGRDLSNSNVLADLAIEVGLPADKVKDLLVSDIGLKEVRDRERLAAEIGVEGVPFFVFNDRQAFSGAQPVAVFLAAFADASEELATTARGEAESCGVDQATGKQSC